MSRVGYEVTMRPVAVHGPAKLGGGTAVGYVASKARAEEICNAMPSHRSYREVPWEQIPEANRLALERAETARS